MKEKRFTVIDRDTISKHPECTWEIAKELALECAQDCNEEFYVVEVQAIAKRPPDPSYKLIYDFQDEEIPFA